MANDDSYAIDEDATLTVPDGATDLLGNDTDASGPPFTATRVTGPAHGTLTLRSRSAAAGMVLMEPGRFGYRYAGLSIW